MKKITKLVLPVAGLGKRLHPITLKVPKALVKVGGEPLLDYILNETNGTDIRDVILIINPSQRQDFEKYLKLARRKFSDLKFHVRVQRELLGTGHVLLQAGELVKKGPFLVRYCDDVLWDRKPFLKQLLEKTKSLEDSATLLTLRRVPKQKVSRFGVIALKGFDVTRKLYRVSGIIEKPAIKEAPSNLILIGAYVVSTSVMSQIRRMDRRTKRNRVNDCLPITDAFALDLARGGKVYGIEFKGRYLDCGTLQGLKETAAFLEKQK